MAETQNQPSAEEIASFRFAGRRGNKRLKRAPEFLVGQTYLKPQGSLQTKWPDLSIQVEVEFCEDCDIFVLDYCEQVQIADCKNCRIFVGPVAGSAFLLDCEGRLLRDCTVHIITKQLRTRDCKNCTLLTFARGEQSNIVESSQEMYFGCWNVAYPGLKQQFESAGFKADKNWWNTVYDFSPVPGEVHWQLLEADKMRGWQQVVVEDGAAQLTHVPAPTQPLQQTDGTVCECPFVNIDGKLYEDLFDTATPPPETAPVAPTEGLQEEEVVLDVPTTVQQEPLKAPPAGLWLFLTSVVVAVATWFGMRKRQ